jgi:peptide/nickel transport system substrate-binding protein
MNTSKAQRHILTRREFLKAGAAMAAGVALAGCGPKSTPVPSASEPSATSAPAVSKDSKVLRVSINETRESLDSALYYGHTDAIIPLNTQEGLIRYKMGTYDFEPQLAESWGIKDGGKAITFKLREGVKYSDGMDLNAETVKFEMDRAMSIGMGPSWLLTDFVDSVSLDGEYEITLALKQVLPGYLHHLANVWSPRFQSPDAYTSNEKDGDMGQEWAVTHTAGTGPYKVVSYEKDSRVVLERNEHYWRGWSDDQIEQVIIDVIMEPSTIRLRLEEGDLDMNFVPLTPNDIAALEGNSNIVVGKFPGGNQYNMGFICDKEPMDNKLVRQALCYAFNYDGVINTLYGGFGQREGSLLLGLEGDKPEHHTHYYFDLDKAAQLLKEAGYPGGGFTLKGISRPVDPNLRRLFELYQSDLKKIGVDMEVEEVSGAVWQQMRKNELERDLLAFYWGPDTLDPGSSIYPMYKEPGSNTHGMNYDNPQVRSWFEEAQLEADKDKRVAIMERIAETLLEDAPAIYMFWPLDVWPYQKWVKNFEYNGFYTMWGARIWDLRKEV